MPTTSQTPPQSSAADDDTPREPAPADSRWAALATAMARAVRRQCPAWLSDHAEDIAQAALAKVMVADQKQPC